MEGHEVKKRPTLHLSAPSQTATEEEVNGSPYKCEPKKTNKIAKQQCLKRIPDAPGNLEDLKRKSERDIDNATGKKTETTICNKIQERCDQ